MKSLNRDTVGGLMMSFVLLALAMPLTGHTQTYTRVEKIEYHDDTTLWVLGQVKKTTCMSAVPAHVACDGGTDSVISQTDYGWKALPWKTYAFGKLQQTLSYDSTSTVASGQLGTLKTAADGNGNTTTLTSWKRGIPQSIKYPGTPEAPGGATQLALVDNNGWIISVTDEAGSKTCYGYDPMGRINLVTYPSETTAGTCDTSAWAATQIAFGNNYPAAYGLPAGHWRQRVITGKGLKETLYDALWRPLVVQTYDMTNTSTTNATIAQVIIRYDHESRKVFESYPQRTLNAAITKTWGDPAVTPNASGSYTTYDALGRVTRTAQDWEGPGQLITMTEHLSGFQTRVTNPRGQQTLTTLYQAFDQPTYDFPRGINHPAGAFTEIHRDIFGKVTALKRRNASGSVALTRSYAYDVHQNLCRTVEPETGATVMGYDGAGNLTWSASGLPASTACNATGNTTAINARKAARTYDARNRLKTLTFAGDGLGNQSWTYTPDGLPATVVTTNDAAGAQQATNSYVYNHRRLPTRESLKVGTALNWPVDYRYNANGHLSTENWHGVSVAYAPNALGQPTRVGTYATSVSYHPNGGVKSFIYGNGLQHTLTQNVRGLPDNSCDFFGSCSTGAVLNDGYDYDQNGNVLAITDGRAGQVGNRTMTYDALDRLTKVVSASAMFGTASYSYDVLDNLTFVGTAGATGAHQAPRSHYYCYDAAWRLTNVKTGSCSGATVVGLGYDVQGNLSNRSGRSHSFDFGNRLRTVGASGSVPAAMFAYDGHGRRVLDQVGTAKKYSHYWRDGRLGMTADERTDKVAEYFYLQGSLVATRERHVPTNVYSVRYQHTDALGSPVAVTNEARGEVERTHYEPYGRPTNRAWRDGVGYTGHVEDAATQLTYMQQRYYDPGIGRFLSVDPVTVETVGAANFNRYWYANNNPYKFTDPDGRDCVTTNGATTCSTANYVVSFPAQKGFRDFTSSSPNYHAYSVPANTSGKTLAENQNFVKNNPTPGFSSPATPEGTFNDATPVIGGISPVVISPVMSFSLTNQLNNQPVVVNVTLPGHPLESGIVVRQPTVDANGNSTIQNWGEGTSPLQAPGEVTSGPINSVWTQQKLGTPNPTGCASGRDSVCNN